MAGKHAGELDAHNAHREVWFERAARRGGLYADLLHRGRHLADSEDNAALRRLTAALYNESSLRVLTLDNIWVA